VDIGHWSRRGSRTLCVALAAAFALAGSAGAASPADRTTTQSHVTLRAQNEPVRSVLVRLARDTGASIAVAEGVSGYVTAELHALTLSQALRAILEPLGASFRLRDGVYSVERNAAAAPGSVSAAATAPAVIQLSIVSPKRAAATLRPLFPQASIREDDRSNALVVVAPPGDVQAMRTVLQGIDVRNPTLPATEALAVRSGRARVLAQQLHNAFPAAKVAVAGDKQLLVTATPSDITQIKAAVAALDAPNATPPPAPISSEAIRLSQRAPRDVARAVVAQVPGLRASVSGTSVVLSGAPDAVSRGKVLVAQLDLPNFGERYTQVYRIRTLDASSVADLLRRSFRDLEITVDAALNALAVSGTAAQQQRIADALAQLDPPPGAQAATGMAGSSGGGSTEVIMLKSFVPGPQQGGVDAVTAISQALQVIASDVRVIQLMTPGQIALVGPPSSVRTAREFIDKVDVVPPLVVLDTEVLEVDESVAKNLGLQLGTAALSSTFSEMAPQTSADGTPPRLGRLQAFTRTGLSFTAQLNLLIQNGKGRVLADPRITTLSGRTASIRAGDTISILTTTAGNAGTIATTQVQSFQTGVTLDITPSVSPDGGIMVALHPVVNSLIGTNGGIPQISTRDTQTTVHLRNDETLVIGGLIQENETRTTTKIPLLGDIPLVGRVFRNDNVQGQRNELIIVVTPHIVMPGTAMPGPAQHVLPTPKVLPTLPPNAQLPLPSGQLPPMRAALPAAPQSTPHPSPAPAASAAPVAVPTAFAQTNVFTFGSAPQTNFAKPSDPVQVFYATLSPTVVSNGTPVRVAAVTTTNASSVKLQIGTQTFGLSQLAPGKWQTTFALPLAALPTGQSAVQLALIASRQDGTSATVPITLNVMP
jgi:type II secretory pathway component GspD/PulD (secretin)